MLKSINGQSALVLLIRIHDVAHEPIGGLAL